MMEFSIKCLAVVVGVAAILTIVLMSGCTDNLASKPTGTLYCSGGFTVEGKITSKLTWSADIYVWVVETDRGTFKGTSNNCMARFDK